MMEPSAHKFWKQRLLLGGISFIAGAFALSLFSVFQKLLMHEASLVLQLRSYLVPVFYGGLTGLILGLWYARLKRNEIELLEAYHSTLRGWAKAVAARDKTTQDHTERVVILTEALAQAREMLESVRFLRRAIEIPAATTNTGMAVDIPTV